MQKSEDALTPPPLSLLQLPGCTSRLPGLRAEQSKLPGGCNRPADGGASASGKGTSSLHAVEVFQKLPG